MHPLVGQLLRAGSNCRDYHDGSLLKKLTCELTKFPSNRPNVSHSNFEAIFYGLEIWFWS